MACSCFFGALSFLMSGEIGRRRFHQSRSRWSHCCRPFTCAREKGILFVPFSQSPFLLGESWASANSNTHFFSHKQEGEEKRGKAISSSIFFPPSSSFFQGRLLRNFLSLSLSLSSFYITVAIATDLEEEEEEKEKKNSGGGGVEMDFFSSLLSLSPN